MHDRSGENGVHLNHRPVQESVLDDGDVIVAGTTGFKVQRSDVPFPRTDVDELSHPGAQRQSERAFSRLSELRLPRFAVLDAARSPIVRKLLLTHPELSFSLYDGLEGEQLGDAAPYLVELPVGSQLAEALVREHWGQGFGCFLFSPGDFKAVRRHLRQFLTVQDAQNKRVYFRFYDPRVLSVFLKNLLGKDCAAFFGPVAYFLTESDRPDVGWLFRRDHDQTYQEAVRFD